MRRTCRSDVEAHLVDVLAFKLGKKLLQALIISLDADRVENALDVLGARARVASKSKKKVSCKANIYNYLSY